MPHYYTLEEQISGKCKHFNGLINTACDNGVVYATVRQPGEVGKPCAYPCWRPPLQGKVIDNCPRRQFPTDDQVEAECKHIRQRADEMLGKLAAGECPHCGQRIERKRQVGRCVYADPCGCRLYQGNVDKGDG